MLKWLKNKGCPWAGTTFNSAASHGSLDNMCWLKANGCLWDKYTFSYAADHGSLDNMKWLRANGCPWDEKTLVLAALKGDLNNMIWLRENGCTWNKEMFLSTSTDYMIWLNSRIISKKVIRWMHENGYYWKDHEIDKNGRIVEKVKIVEKKSWWRKLFKTFLSKYRV